MKALACKPRSLARKASRLDPDEKERHPRASRPCARGFELRAQRSRLRSAGRAALRVEHKGLRARLYCLRAKFSALPGHCAAAPVAPIASSLRSCRRCQRTEVLREERKALPIGQRTSLVPFVGAQSCQRTRRERGNSTALQEGAAPLAGAGQARAALPRETASCCGERSGLPFCPCELRFRCRAGTRKETPGVATRRADPRRTQVIGQWFYLYLILDLYSRKIVGFTVEIKDDADHAAHLVPTGIPGTGFREHRPGTPLGQRLRTLVQHGAPP